MADAQLSVELIARINNLQDGLKAAASEVAGFDTKLATQLRGISTRFENVGKKVQESLNIEGAVSGTSQAIEKVGVSAVELSQDIEKVGVSVVGLSQDVEKAGVSSVQLSQDIEKVGVSSVQLSQDVEKAGVSAVQLSQEIEKVGVSATKVAPAINQAGKALKDVSPSSNRATEALNNLSRVAQDAPFGFLGIANNLNPLFESFSRLRNESQGTGGALKALGSSLLGAGGLGLALGVVSAALTIGQIGLRSWRFGVSDAKVSTEDYIKSLSNLNAAILKGNQNSAEELGKLKVIYQATQDITIPIKTRNELIDYLQKQYPSYLGNLSNDAILAGKAAGQYEKLVQQLIAVGRAKGFQDQIGKNAVELLTFNKQLEESKKRVEELNKIQETTVQLGQDNLLPGRGQVLASRLQNTPIETERTKELEKQEAIKKQIAKLNNEDLDIEKRITAIVKERGASAVTGGDKSTGKVTVDTGSSESSVKGLSSVLAELQTKLQIIQNTIGLTFDAELQQGVKAYQDTIDTLIKQGFNPAGDVIVDLKNKLIGLDAQLGAGGFEARLAAQEQANASLLKNQQEYLNERLALEQKEVDQGYQVNKQLDSVWKEKQNQQDKAQIDELNRIKTFNQQFGQAQTELLAGIADAFANSIGAGEDLGSGIIKAFGAFLSKFGDLLIQFGLGAKAFQALKIAIATGGAGPVTLGLAVLAIAAGIALKAAAAAIAKHAGGGGGGGGTGSASSNPGVNVSGTINTDNELKRTSYANEQKFNAAGNRSDPQIVVLETRISNDAIYVASKRGANSFARKT